MATGTSSTCDVLSARFPYPGLSFPDRKPPKKKCRCGGQCSACRKAAETLKTPLVRRYPKI
jgi:hypothetical protein